MRALVLVTLALLSSLIPMTRSQLVQGRYQGNLTIVAGREIAGRASFTKCGQILHIWLHDTVSPDLSMEFGTRVASLRPGVFRAQPMDLLRSLYPSQPQPGLNGYFSLYIPHDTMFFADSGTLRLDRIDSTSMEGQFDFVVSEAWRHQSARHALVTGAFRAIRNTAYERTVYRRAHCDHPGTEWPLDG